MVDMPPKSVFQKRMTKYLVIVESPSKIKKIEGYLGSDYAVIATCGHLCALTQLPWKSIQSGVDFEPTYTLIDTKKSHINEMSKIIQQYPKTCIMLATDNDREGEAIAFHICRMFDLPMDTTVRILFNEITQDALLKAIRQENQSLLNMSLVRSQQARQVLDLMIGFKISPLLWKHLYYSKDHALSAGRCQTPALRLIYEKTKQPDTSHYCYKTTARFFPHPFTLSVELNHEFTEAEEVNTFIDLSKAHIHTFCVHDKKVSTRSPPRPFHTSSLLQSASNILHYSPKVTNQLAQKLYQAGHITYIRTEAKTYSQDFLAEAGSYIAAKYGTKCVGPLSRISNEKEKLPHEAIRVTKIAIQEISGEDPQMNSLYKLIWRTTVESCMSEAQFHTHKVTIDAPQNHTYVTSLDVPISLGWMQVQPREKETTSSWLFYVQSLGKKIAPSVSIDSKVIVKGGNRHYTESGLIQHLEELEIGRPSTYALFVDTLIERGYIACTEVPGTERSCTDFRWMSDTKMVERQETKKVFGEEKKKLVIQPALTLCIEFLLKHFHPFFDYSYTKKMEEELDKICDHIDDIVSWKSLCLKTYTDIVCLVDPVSQNEKKMTIRLDEEHEVVFQKHGPTVRKQMETGVEYLPIKENILLDTDRLKRGEYSVDDLLAYPSFYLGEHEGKPVHIKKGPYGTYIAWGDVRKSIKEMGITIEQAILYLKETPTISSNVMREIDSSTSIRRGKYGPYLYHKTGNMKQPKFVALKKFKGDYLSCDHDVLHKNNWINIRRMQA